MGSKITAFFSLALSTMLAGTAIVMILSFNNHAYAAGSNWYLGAGAEKDMWFKYDITYFETNNGSPFQMIIWLKDQDDKGNWIAPTWVVDQGKVINGTMRLGQEDLAPLAGGQIPSQMSDFVSGYRNSLQWLSAYASLSHQQSLNAGSHWGVIAQIGGSPIDVVNQEKVQFGAAQKVCGADSCASSVVGWHKGVDSKIWVLAGFPYPVKADTFVSVSSGKPPTQFKFQLLDTGTGQPPVLQAGVFLPKPPLKEATGRGTYIANLNWTPQSIGPGSEITFELTFTDNNGNALTRVNYDFAATDANGKVIQEFKNQNTNPETGAAIQKVKFDKAGSAKISVTVNSANGQVAGGEAGFLERSDFNIVVAPEFPAGVVLVGTATLIGVVFVLTRFTRGGLTKLSDK